jgi:hypothetical protein
MRYLWALLVAAAGMPSSQDTSRHLAGQPGGEADGRLPSALRVSSTIPELRIDRASMVPEAAPRREVEGDCGERFTAPMTNIGREIARRGWRVTSEAHAGAHGAIGYVRGLLHAPIGLCLAVDGHVAIVERGRLMAIVSAARRDPSDGHDANGGTHNDVIGYVSKVPGSGNFRITETTGLWAPLAEIRIGPNEIRVGRLAPRDSFCGGRVSIPNIYDRSMVAASRILRTEGWRPINARLGLEECQMMGLGFCGYRYRRGRQSLEITTDNDQRHVLGYEPRCRA